MKIVLSLVLIALSVGVCVAQTPSNKSAAPGVMVVESGWRKISTKHNSALDDDPLAPLENQDRSERIRTKVIEQNRINAGLARDQAPLPSRNPIPPVQMSPHPSSPFDYVYRVKITNTGAKKIRAIVWEYVALDPFSGSELGRHRFTSTVSLGRGKSTTLFGYSTLPPTSTIDASSAGEKPEGQKSEHVVITKILYEDNTFWNLEWADPSKP